MVRFGRVVAILWTLPNTVLGLLVGFLSFQWPRAADGVLVFDGPARGTLAIVTVFRRTAVTLGHVVLSSGRLHGALLAHELHHVWQYERLGPLFLPVYLVVWLFTGYRRHPFELAAVLAEAQAMVRPAGPA